MILTLYCLNRTLKNKVRERTAALNMELQERIRAEASRLESETKFKFLVENCPIPMALEDKSGNIKYFNPCFINLFGYTINDFPSLETGFLHLYPDPVYRAEVAENWAIATLEAKDSGDVIRCEDLIFTCRDGRILNIDVIGVPIGDDILSVFIDQTEKKHAERMVIQTEKMLSVGGMAAGMAHEINNPLGIILSSAQNIERRVDPTKEKNRLVAEKFKLDIKDIHDFLSSNGVLKYLGYIQETGARAGEIVRSMLDFSCQNNSIKLEYSINDILERSVKLISNDYDLKKSYDFKKIRIKRDYHAELSPVSVIRSEMEQVFLNILKNSAQAVAQNNSILPLITLRTFEDSHWVTAELSDNGPGMNFRDQKRVFEPFYTTKPAGKGTGLGLSVSYFIITRNHNGQVELESHPEYGTKFIIRLPKTTEAEKKV
jgi:PAS domain S-box-containing protein